jgi:hypothetical protein
MKRPTLGSAFCTCARDSAKPGASDRISQPFTRLQLNDELFQQICQIAGEGPAFRLSQAGRLIGGGSQGVDAGGLQRSGGPLDAVGDEGNLGILASTCGQAVQPLDTDPVILQSLVGEARDKAGLAAELGLEAKPVDESFGRWVWYPGGVGRACSITVDSQRRAG